MSTIWRELSLKGKAKLVSSIVVLAFVGIVMLQNLQTVEFQMFWIPLPMPLSVLMLIFILLGVLIGFGLAVFYVSRSNRAEKHE